MRTDVDIIFKYRRSRRLQGLATAALGAQKHRCVRTMQ
jgi:hypothetical protein